MAVSRPYYRVFRHGQDVFGEYVFHSRYADNRQTLIKAFYLIQQDLVEIFEYIEPSKHNESVYSHRIYELFLRACTEFETNCKSILGANRYKCLHTPNHKQLNIIDFHEIEIFTRLSGYELKLEIYHPTVLKLQPFKDWENSHFLDWYQSYNLVKHDRYKNFKQANFGNLLKAVGGLYCVLFSQFGVQVLSPYNKVISFNSDDEHFIYDTASVFGVKPFDAWPATDVYHFDWNKLQKEADPFVAYFA